MPVGLKNGLQIYLHAPPARPHPLLAPTPFTSVPTYPHPHPASPWHPRSPPARAMPTARRWGSFWEQRARQLQRQLQVREGWGTPRPSVALPHPTPSTPHPLMALSLPWTP